MRKIINLNVDLFEEDLYKKFTVKQFDDIDLKVKVMSKGVLYDTAGQSVRFYCRKNDGTILYQTENITIKNNEINIRVNNQATACAGLAYAELELYDELGKISTATFTFDVRDKVGAIEDAIESVDEIYILEVIEEFIKQAKIDLELYKEAIINLNDEVVKNSEKINNLNEKIEEANINIDETKEQVLTEINNAKDNSLNELNNKHTEVIETINTNIQEGLNNVNNAIETGSNNINNAINEGIDNINNTVNENIEELQTLKADLQHINQVAQNTKVQLKAEHTTAENRRKALQEVVDSANAINELLITTKEEASNKEINLSELIERVNSLIIVADNNISALNIENAQAEANINELNPLNIEADENIVELRALIQQAIDIAIPALKAYIAEHTPAEDLTEVNMQLEELYNAVNELNIRFNSYYTREEVDSKIDEKISSIDLSNYYNKAEINELLEDKVGFIGNNPLPECFKSFEKNPDAIDYLYFYNAGKSKYTIIEWYKATNKSLRIPTSGGYTKYVEFYISSMSIETAIKVYVWNGTDWTTEKTTASTGHTVHPVLKNIGAKVMDNIYHSTIEVNSDLIEGGIHPLELIEGDITGDFNNAIKYKKYNVLIENNDVVNAPTENLKGILLNDLLGDTIRQTVISNDNNVKYSRFYADYEWSEWKNEGIVEVDLSNYYNKQETDNKIDEKISLIEIPEMPEIPEVDLSDYYTKSQVDELIKDKHGLIGELIIPDFYKTAPASPFDDETYSVIRFKGNDGYNYIGYAKNNEGYPSYLKKSGTTERLYGGIDTNNCKFYKYNGSSWSFLNNNSIAMNTNTSLNDVYTNNVDIIYHAESDEQYRGNIWKKGTDDNVVAINDYNNAVKYEKYTINQTESEIFNSPVNGVFNGILINDIVDNVIHQTVISNNNEVKYSRCRVNSEWTVWKDEGQVDLSDYYNKEEIDAKLVKEVGIIKSGDPNFREPVWDELPTNTFINIPANPDPNTYKWEMKCSHYGYHMVFYFPIDPTGKFGIVKRTDGKLGFKLLDSSFKYTTYKSYYKEKNSSKNWSNMPSDNHFINPTKRELEAIYSHNFDIVDGDNPDKIFRYGSQNDFDAEFIKDFNDATELEVYTVDATGEGVIGNSPISGAYKGILRVLNINGLIHQTLETTKGETSKRLYINGKWTEWSREAEFEIEPEQYSERNGEYITNSLIELYNGNLRFEYGEYVVDSAKNSPHVANPTKEYTDLVMLKAGGFRQVLGCMVFPHKLDFHYSMYCNINMVLVDPSNKPDCMRLYIGYLGDRTEAFHPENGLSKVKYCVFGY